MSTKQTEALYASVKIMYIMKNITHKTYL